jgi:MurNAc alpha-1-phosphate uridylyltransferase
MKAMILAAGLGNRMRPLTDNTPKPLLRAAGKPLIEYHLENLQRAGVREVVINLAYLGEKIRTHLGDGTRWNLQIRYSQEHEPLETGGAILRALDLLGDETFLLVNGDVWCDIEFSELTSTILKPIHQGHLLLVPNPGFHPHGDFALDSSGLLLDDPEKSHPQRFTFAGISLLKPELVSTYPNKREKFPLVEAFRHAITQHKLSGHTFHGHWSDVGTPERLHDLDNHLARQGL